MMAPLRRWLKASQTKWLSQRLPRQREVLLGLKNIFIIPTRLGAGLLLTLLVMLVAAINYQNALIYLFTFWLGSAFLISIHLTFRQLMGIQVRVVGHQNGHAGQNAQVTLRLDSGRKGAWDITLNWPGTDPVVLDLKAGEATTVTLQYPTQRRGPLEPDRLRIESRAPYGLAVAWTNMSLKVGWLIYPKSVEGAFNDLQGALVDEQEQQVGRWIKGNTDFSHVRAYQQGDSLKRIHWRHYAKSEELVTREFVDFQSADLWVDWDKFAGLDTEERLSRMCFWVLSFQEQQLEYGLRLPNMELAPALSLSHQQHCLEALARYDY